ncbi:MAG: recombinase family protein [Angelakisella sp.]
MGVFFQNDNINTLDEDSELRLTIMSSIAQDEVRKISERVKFGFRRSIEQGRVLGSNRIWGYTKDNGKLVIDPQEAELVRTIFDLYANHDIGMRGIAQQLSEQGYSNSEGNSFSFSTIKGILTNPKYKGYYCGNKSHKLDYKSKEIKNLAPADWTMYKDEAGDTVPAIVTEEVWDRANKILAQRSAKMSSDNPTSYQNKYTYSGKLLCMEHHQPFYRALYRYDSGNKELWQCKCYIEKGKAGCASPAVYTEELNEIMHGCYEDLIINKADIVHELVTMYSTLSQSSGLQGELEKQRQQGNEVLRRKDKLLDLSLKGRITDEEFETRNATFNKELEQLRQEADRLTEGIALNSSMKQSVETLRGVIQREIDFTDGLPDNVVDSLLDRVEVYKSGDRHKVELKVYFKVIEEPAACRIARSRGNTSVCSRQYI